MTATTCCAENFSWLSPYLMVKDADATLQFYQKAFGFEKLQAVPGEDGTTMHAELKYKGQTLMIGKQGAYKKEYGDDLTSPNTSKTPSPITLYAYCENVDKFYQSALAAGAKSISEPQDMFWGDRMCRLQDLDGYVWAFATHIGHHK